MEHEYRFMLQKGTKKLTSLALEAFGSSGRKNETVHALFVFSTTGWLPFLSFIWVFLWSCITDILNVLFIDDYYVFSFWNGSSTSWVLSTYIWIKTLSKFETLLFVKLCKMKGTISGVSILNTFKVALSAFEALVLVILWKMKGTAFELFSYNFITVEYSFSGNRSSRVTRIL